MDAVVAGGRNYISRDESEELIATDHTWAAALLPLVERAGVTTNYLRTVRADLDAARRMAAGEVLSDAELAAVGASLVDPKVRETLIRTVGSGEEPQDDRLWLLLSRVLIGPWRCQALMLVATAALVRGEGQLAETALLAATEDLADAWESQNGQGDGSDE